MPATRPVDSSLQQMDELKEEEAPHLTDAEWQQKVAELERHKQRLVVISGQYLQRIEYLKGREELLESIVDTKPELLKAIQKEKEELEKKVIELTTELEKEKRRLEEKRREDNREADAIKKHLQNKVIEQQMEMIKLAEEVEEESRRADEKNRLLEESEKEKEELRRKLREMEQKMNEVNDSVPILSDGPVEEEAERGELRSDGGGEAMETMDMGMQMDDFEMDNVAIASDFTRKGVKRENGQEEMNREQKKGTIKKEKVIREGSSRDGDEMDGDTSSLRFSLPSESVAVNGAMLKRENQGFDSASLSASSFIVPKGEPTEEGTEAERAWAAFRKKHPEKFPPIEEGRINVKKEFFFEKWTQMPPAGRNAFRREYGCEVKPRFFKREEGKAVKNSSINRVTGSVPILNDDPIERVDEGRELGEERGAEPMEMLEMDDPFDGNYMDNSGMDGMYDDPIENGDEENDTVGNLDEHSDEEEEEEEEVGKRRRSTRNLSKSVKYADSMEESDEGDEPYVKKERTETVEMKVKAIPQKRRSDSKSMKKDIEGKGNDTEKKDLECPECEYRSKSVGAWITHLRDVHSTNPALSGCLIRCDCGHESYSNTQHNYKCEIANFTIIRTGDGTIRRLTDPVTTPQCVLCKVHPKTSPGYIVHLSRHHKTSLKANNIYLSCSCGFNYTSSNDCRRKKQHDKECSGREFTLHKLDED